MECNPGAWAAIIVPIVAVIFISAILIWCIRRCRRASGYYPPPAPIYSPPGMVVTTDRAYQNQPTYIAAPVQPVYAPVQPGYAPVQPGYAPNQPVYAQGQPMYQPKY